MPTLMETSEQLSSDAVFGRFSFEHVDVAGVPALVTRTIPPGRAVELWRRARSLSPAGPWPLLTHDDHVHPDIETLRPLESLSLDEVRSRRTAALSGSRWTRNTLDAIASAYPQPEPYVEEDVFFQDPPEESRLSLVFVDRPLEQSVQPFSPDGEGLAPRQAELVVMLRHWHAVYAAEPLYADGKTLELVVEHPPRELGELRALAQDFFLSSPGCCEGFGLEEPNRLLRRLMHGRWVVWWYGIT